MMGLFGWESWPTSDAVAVVVSYASMEAPFLPLLLEQCQLFSRHVVVVQGDRLYSDSPRDEPVLVERAPELPAGVAYARYTVNPSLPISERRGVRRRPTAYFHNLARWSGVTALRSSAGREAENLWVLLLDGDEVPDGNRVRGWFGARHRTLDTSTAYKMANYWHYGDVRWRARTWEDSVVLVHMSVVGHEKAVFGDKERDHVARSAPRCERMVTGEDGLPMFTHYSWCRTRVGMRRKLETWAHRDDKFKNVPVESLLARIFEPPVPGETADGVPVRDVVHGYRYDLIEGDPGIERVRRSLASLDEAGG